MSRLLCDARVRLLHTGGVTLGERRWVQAGKVYVQQRVREAGRRVWELLEGGAHFYVCGDAGGMAPAVQAALLDVIQDHQVLQMPLPLLRLQAVESTPPVRQASLR